MYQYHDQEANDHHGQILISGGAPSRIHSSTITWLKVSIAISLLILINSQFRSLVGHQFTFPTPLEHDQRRGRRKSERGEDEEEVRGRRRSMRGEEEQPRSISRLGSLPLAGSNSALSSVLHIHVSSKHLNLSFSQLIMFLNSIPFVPTLSSPHL